MLFIIPSITFAQKDTTYWNHIYHPKRLFFICPDTTINGRVLKIVGEKDGDYHVIVQTGTNKIDVEIICHQPEKNIICNCYTNKITIPHRKDSIIVKGDYVFDLNHKWYEIHPVKNLTIIK